MNYFIILKLDEDCEIEVGRLGKILFKKGYYIYCGSAKRGFSKRIKRHFSKKKKLWWHIDYLSMKAQPIEAYKCKGSEHQSFTRELKASEARTANAIPICSIPKGILRSL